MRLQSRRERRAKDVAKRAFVALFLIVFVASVVGVAVVSIAR